MELFKAHAQWKNRPADERFSGIEALTEAAQAARKVSKVAKLNLEDAEIATPDGVELGLASKSGGFARFTNYSFSQFCQRIGAPPSYLSTLSPGLASAAMNEGMKAKNLEGEARILLDVSAPGVAPAIRGITSPSYSRLWDSDLYDRMIGLVGSRWEAPLQYAGGSFGGELVPGGAYRGDRSSFLFMVQSGEATIEDGSTDGLKRGFFVWNSEVGERSFGLQTFLYRRVCGNNIVWGAESVTMKRLRHVGAIEAKSFGELEKALGEYTSSSVSKVESAIRAAREHIIEADAVKLAKKVSEVTGLSPKTITSAVEANRAHEATDHAVSESSWGMVQALTRYAQLSKWTEDRIEVDAAAAKLMSRFTV